MKYYSFEVMIATNEEIKHLSFVEQEAIYKKISKILNLKEANFLSPTLKLYHQTKD